MSTVNNDTRDDAQIPLNEFVEAHVEHVIQEYTTDSSTNYTWAWYLDDGSKFTTTREHYEPGKFAYLASISDYDVAPRLSEGVGVEWEAWIMEHLQLVADRIEVRGPRAKAVDDLREILGEIPVYEDKAPAVERDMPYREDAETLWIPQRCIRLALRDYEVSRMDFFIEMDTQGYNVGDSEQLESGRYWSRMYPVDPSLLPHGRRSLFPDDA